MTTLQGGSEWFTFLCSVPTVKARPSSRLASKPTGPNAIAVKTSSAHGGSFSCSTDRDRAPEIRRQVIDMAINGSGIRDTARVLRISPTTVIAVLKKAAALRHVNPALLPSPCSHAISVPVDTPPSSMKCGVSSGPKRLHGGCGMRSIITQGEYLPLWWAPGRMRCS